MEEAALQRRLDRIRHRQTYIILLLVYPYLVGITWMWLSQGRVGGRSLLAAVLPGIALVAGGYLVVLYRARKSRDS